MDIMHQRVLDLIGKKRGSGSELARALNLAKNTVTEWRAGRSNSYKKYAPQIAEYYGVSLDWLSGLTDDRTGIKKEALPDEPARPNRERVMKIAATMDEDDLAALIAFAEYLEKQKQTGS